MKTNRILMFVIFLTTITNTFAEDNDMFGMFGNRILEEKKIEKTYISNENKKNNEVTIYGNILDAYGEVNIDIETKNEWEEGDTLVTGDGVLVLKYNNNSNIILMENTKIKILHDHINMIKGKLYFDISKEDSKFPLKISTNFSKFLELIEGKGIIKLNEEIGQIKLLNGFIKVYNSLKFFDNYNITSNYICQYEYENENDEKMKLTEKELFYDRSEFDEIEIYLENEDDEIYLENEKELNSYLNEQEN